MSEKRFVQLGDTHIKDMVTGEEWYAPCETSLLKLLNEQQATIHKLQDLCGESDGENAKLRIENKRLQEENEQLKADEKLYAKEILRLKEELKEKEIVKLGGDY